MVKVEIKGRQFTLAASEVSKVLAMADKDTVINVIAVMKMEGRDVLIYGRQRPDKEGVYG